LMERGYVQHILGNGAVAIHDWEFAYHGRTTEDVEKYVSEGQFGLWEETGKYINKAIKWGALSDKGFGESVGEMIHDEEVGGEKVRHVHKESSVLGKAYELGVPVSISVGIGQDIIQMHPDCDGAALGKTSYSDFLSLAETLRGFENGVLVSMGSAVMAPMVFEKAMTMAKNVNRASGRKLEDYGIVVNDIQPSTWDWTRGDPPMENPAYFLRFFKSFSRLGGESNYVEMDNRKFIRSLQGLLK